MTISAQIIADSISPTGKRLTTLQLRYPRFIHAEFMTHRAFSRNASSSRAIPVARMIADIRADTAMPKYWGANQKGMQAGEELDAMITGLPVLVTKDKKQLYGLGEVASLYPDIPNMGGFGEGHDVDKEEAWCQAREFAIAVAQAYDRAGYHKQIVNRVLEPFMHINVLVTATEWDNFFALRDHPDAEPHIQELARTMKAAMFENPPALLEQNEWHLPYVRPDEYSRAGAIKVSVARCARVSYLTHDGRETTFDEDLQLYKRLLSTPLHASPMEHQAEYDDRTQGWWSNPDLHGNLVGWKQYRKMLEQELASAGV